MKACPPCKQSCEQGDTCPRRTEAEYGAIDEVVIALFIVALAMLLAGWLV